ncbi:MAG: diphosphomevalonate decarboxylase [Anaerolineae bacterium UTCFX2]|jgi:diphosphomevalonate decarboxylase|nr:diphosphomevalonate decarboxylase [Anaerolineae bacterium]MCZ7552885.1 diphosphomevalonate decarboxylase [Anaerolineales bacterium]OQY91441.1 MAG: diphosphomevalonate decarboxylase [Anaerolineae bacterium UTCFX2]
MPAGTATAISCPNIAFIKYWGNRDNARRIPANGSISMNLAGLYSHTQVAFGLTLEKDRLFLDGEAVTGAALRRASALLDRVRALAGVHERALVRSYNNFPTGTGIASSASGFAALTLAASRAAGLDLAEAELSRLARTASGSACRSIPGGFVEWRAGYDHASSYAFSIAPPEHWELTDCIAVISQSHKPTTSQEGHLLADTSPLQAARVSSAESRLRICRNAILARDFEALAQVTELDSNLMHAVMLTGSPGLMYWLPATILVMRSVQGWRRGGLPACFTVDAGPNVHVICPTSEAQHVIDRLNQLDGVIQVLSAAPGEQARLVTNNLD